MKVFDNAFLPTVQSFFSSFQPFYLAPPGIRCHSNPSTQLIATKACRQMLSKEKNPPIEQVIHAGLVPELVKFLDDRFATVLELGETG